MSKAKYTIGLEDFHAHVYGAWANGADLDAWYSPSSMLRFRDYVQKQYPELLHITQGWYEDVVQSNV
jgi:hypothetical protein